MSGDKKDDIVIFRCKNDKKVHVEMKQVKKK